jgi:hypothetical protein
MRSAVRPRSIEFPLESSGQPWRSHQRRADLEERARKAVAFRRTVNGYDHRFDNRPLTCGETARAWACDF